MCHAIVDSKCIEATNGRLHLELDIPPEGIGIGPVTSGIWALKRKTPKKRALTPLLLAQFGA